MQAKHVKLRVNKCRKTVKTKIKFTSIKCLTNPQHNTTDKKLYSYGNANIAGEINLCSSEYLLEH